MKIKEKMEQFKWRVNGKVNSFKKEVEKKAQETAKWVSENKEVVIVLTPVVYKVGKGVIKYAINRYDDKRESYERELMHWDPSAGEWFDSRRPLTSKEKVRMSELQAQNNWNKGEALKHMGLLSKK